MNVPVRLNSTIQERWINPGDFIIADLNGVVCVPQALVTQVLDAVPGIAETNQRCADAIKQGRTVAETFKEFREQ